MTEVIYSAESRMSTAAAVRELWRARGLVAAFVERDIRIRYKRTFLGIGWAALQPLALIFVFAFAFNRAAQVSTGDTTYAAFALSSLVPWVYLQGAIAYASSALVQGADVVRKSSFPREAPVLAATIASLVDLGVGFGLVFAVGPVVGAQPAWTWFFAPLLAAPLFLLAAGLGLAFSVLSAYYRDVRFLVPFFLQLWLFASPVIYPVTAVPEGWRTTYLLVNPAAGILDGFRRIFAEGDFPHFGRLAIGALGCVVIVSLGFVLFKRLERNLADVL